MADSKLSQLDFSKFSPYTLKEQQIHVLKLLLKAKHVFASLPTGYGKSELYGILPKIQDELEPSKKHTVLVISPLKALIADQIERWTERGMKCVAFSERMPEEAVADAMRQIPGCDIIFSSPEAIQEHVWWNFIQDGKKVHISCLVVDEVHCLLDWGVDFREKFLAIPDVRSILEDETPVLLLTGTACKDMFDKLQEAFGVKFHIISAPADRPNIRLAIERIKVSDFADGATWYMDLLMEKLEHTPKCIIYCQSTIAAGNIYTELVYALKGKLFHEGRRSCESVLVEQFHGTSTEETQERVLRRFKEKDTTLRCIVATVAFGLGIHVPDVRYVIFWGPPKNTYTYWQEVGRCGRDGQPAESIMYLAPYTVDKSRINKDMLNIVAKYRDGHCIRKMVLANLCVKGNELNDWNPPAQCCSPCCS